MKVPLSWLREWVQWPQQWDTHELAQRLTFAGFEIEAIEAAAPAFSGVVVARIVSVEPHPRADRLRVCQVATTAGAGADSPGSTLQLICAAANARAGLITALATVGARLPGDVVISAVQMRGVQSNGMLCSMRDLGLADSSEGILELPDDAPLGEDLRAYLDLNDPVFEINVTPNRGDAMSVLGVARELAALAGVPLRTPDAPTTGAGAHDPAPGQAPGDEHLHGHARERAAEGCAAPASIPVTLEPGAGAGRLLVGVVRGIDNTHTSPLWMRERLRRAGLRSISAVVDVTNYVMLDLGQPMHAYDLAKLRGELTARRARPEERLQLLDGREVQLQADVLVIADEAGAVGIAGVMGGARTAISTHSREIALEVAWFAPAAIAGRARRYGLSSDASQRFERGVDWRVQERALEHAVRLIRQITGGESAGRSVVQSAPDLPSSPTVPLRARQLQRLLGLAVPAAEVERRLRALGMLVTRQSQPQLQPGGESNAAQTWRVQPPSWRLDIAIEADLIEEVARLGGFDAIGELDAELAVVPRAPAAQQIDETAVMQAANARGYQQIITYGFVDPALQRQLLGAQPAIELANPIASDLAVMRGSLWPGLINVARENLRRQQSRVRLFEIATCFLVEGRPTADRAAASGADAGRGCRYREQKRLGALALGTRLPEQWGSAATAVDFYDAKGDLCSLLALAGETAQISFAPAVMECLHPGRSARVLRAGEPIGLIGELHPALVRTLEFSHAPILFEFDYERAFGAQLAQFREVSRFPRIRRDISLTVPDQVNFASVRERVTVAASTLLKELQVFDVYRGAGVEPGRKSLALGLILQDLSRTLTDEEADRVVTDVLDDLRQTLDARIRE